MDYSTTDYLALDDVIGQNIRSINLGALAAEDYLEHYQVKGAKHGVRRYQNRDGSLTPLGREHYGVGGPRTKSGDTTKAPKRSFSEVARDVHARHKAASSARKLARKKDYLRDHPEKLFKQRKKLSDDDIKEVMSRIEFDKKIKEVRDQEIDRKLKNLENITSKSFNILKNSVGMYNQTAMLYNAFLDNTREPDPAHPRRRLAQAGFKNGEGGGQKKSGDGSQKKTEGAEGESEKPEGDSKKPEGDSKKPEGGGSKKSGGSEGGGSKKSGGSEGGGSKKSKGSGGGGSKKSKGSSSTGSSSSKPVSHPRPKFTIDSVLDSYGRAPISEMADSGDWMRSWRSSDARSTTRSDRALSRMFDDATSRISHEKFTEIASTPLWKIRDT